MIEPVTSALLATVLIVAVYLDIRTSRIPNWLTFTGMGGGFLAHLLINGTEGAIFSFLGLGTGLVLFLTFYLLGDMGGGDVKLMAAMGALVGPYGAFICGLLAIILGGVGAVGVMIYQLGIVDTAQRLVSAVKKAMQPGCGEAAALSLNLRYAVPIAGGTLLYRLGLHPFGG